MKKLISLILTLFLLSTNKFSAMHPLDDEGYDEYGKKTVICYTPDNKIIHLTIYRTVVEQKHYDIENNKSDQKKLNEYSIPSEEDKSEEYENFISYLKKDDEIKTIKDIKFENLTFEDLNEEYNNWFKSKNDILDLMIILNLIFNELSFELRNTKPHLELNENLSKKILDLSETNKAYKIEMNILKRPYAKITNKKDHKTISFFNLENQSFF